MPDMAKLEVAEQSSRRAYAMAGRGPAEIDLAMLYDSFTITVLMTLEALGLCGYGEGKEFVRGGRTGPGGAFPVNTNGGGLSYCHPGMYGLFTIIEACRQLWGIAGERQADRRAHGDMPRQRRRRALLRRDAHPLDGKRLESVSMSYDKPVPAIDAESEPYWTGRARRPLDDPALRQDRSLLSLFAPPCAGRGRDADIRWIEAKGNRDRSIPSQSAMRRPGPAFRDETPYVVACVRTGRGRAHHQQPRDRRHRGGPYRPAGRGVLRQGFRRPGDPEVPPGGLNPRCRNASGIISASVAAVAVFAAAVWALTWQLRDLRWDELVPPARSDSAAADPGGRGCDLRGLSGAGGLRPHRLSLYRAADGVRPGRVRFLHLLRLQPQSRLRRAHRRRAVRFRFYTDWGVPPGDVARVVLYAGIVYYLCALSVGGLLTLPQCGARSRMRAGAGCRPWFAPIASVWVLCGALYVVWCLCGRPVVRVGEREVTPPKISHGLIQFCVGILEWVFTSAVLYLVLPPDFGMSYWHFVAVYVLAYMAGHISHVPGGLGVFETVLLGADGGDRPRPMSWPRASSPTGSSISSCPWPSPSPSSAPTKPLGGRFSRKEE